jgi:hypothetical protein
MGSMFDPFRLNKLKITGEHRKDQDTMGKPQKFDKIEAIGKRLFAFKQYSNCEEEQG